MTNVMKVGEELYVEFDAKTKCCAFTISFLSAKVTCQSMCPVRGEGLRFDVRFIPPRSGTLAYKPRKDIFRANVRNCRFQSHGYRKILSGSRSSPLLWRSSPSREV